ncbi:MAG: MBL fold metallo-hydrolase [Acidobacteria bacterium]|nr:MAG: MBL fold metallo-hydrolase [Acidobacteriota bacterium]
MCILLAGSLLPQDAKPEWWKKLPRPIYSTLEKVKQSQDWFEVYRIRPGVFAIYEPGQWEEVISYLIIGSKSALLFDTGLGIGDMHQVVSELTPMEPLVINSHTHYDHVGGNYQFGKICGTTTDFTTTKAKGSSHDEVKEFVSKGWIWKPTPAGFSPDSYSIRPFQITCTVKDGDHFDLGDRVLEVILTPGHTPDSLCLLDRKNRLLFTGDTFYPAPLYAQFPESDVHIYAQSAAKLDKLTKDVDILLPAHNEPVAPAICLTRMNQAFQSILDGSAKFEMNQGVREYHFEGFSIMTKAEL